MRYIIITLALLISFFLLFSCSTPDWEKRGFKNKAQYEAHLLDSLWLNDDEKFVGVYTGVEEGGWTPYMYEKTFTMEILEDGTGKFDEEERNVDNGYRSWGSDTFKWKKIDGETILITGFNNNKYNGKYFFSFKYGIIDLKTLITYQSFTRGYEPEYTQHIIMGEGGIIEYVKQAKN